MRGDSFLNVFVRDIGMNSSVTFAVGDEPHLFVLLIQLV